ncbi:MAG TPA: DUF885 domain-containing protein [Thermoanaerobaculia bacterium]|nr:DUF885 domain-containing protein [Thermoanaerobaculia bacterium]
MPTDLDDLEHAPEGTPGRDGPPAAGAAFDLELAAAWDQFVTSFIADYFAAHPTFAVAVGRHELDGRLPDWSRGGIEGEVARLRAERHRVGAVPAELLDEGRRFERAALLAQIDADLFWMADADWPARNPIYYSAPLDPSIYLSRPYAPVEERMRAYIGYARALPEAVAQIQAVLTPPLPQTYYQLGLQTFAGLVEYCESQVPSLFAQAAGVSKAAEGETTAKAGRRRGGPDLRHLLAELRAANAPAVAALRRLKDQFQVGLHSGPRSDFRLGAERLQGMLVATERVEVPLADLAAAGRRELARNLEALREACAAYAPGESVETCMARVQAAKPPEGPVAAARRQLAVLRRFVEERQLVSIPGDEEALIAEAPPHQRWNSAYIDIPGPFDRHLPAIYYITPPDPSWSESERHAYLPGEADLLFVTAHEVWPGHFLQFLHSNRASSRVGQLFVSYAFAEGWAHYSEEMIWEAGFGDGRAEVHIGQLQNALLRNVRLLVAIDLHAGDMTIEQAEDEFRRHAFQDPASARQQAARGTFDPAYLNYTLGKLMVRKLRQDWLARPADPSEAATVRQESGALAPGGRRQSSAAAQAAENGRSWRAFHDRLLSFGGPPLPLVRAAMLPGDRGTLL